MAQAHYDIYREQLENLHYGHALWEPSPAGLYDRVRVGDVGFVRSGHFMRLFNVLLPANDPNQGYELPPNFVPLNMGHFQNIRVLPLPYGDYYSTTVVATRDAIGAQIQAAPPDEVPNSSFRCRGGKGAVLCLPFVAYREDAIRTKAFEVYMRRHCDSWLEFALSGGYDVKLEDLTFVTGCDLTSSWANAVFMNPPWDVEVTLSVRPVTPGTARFHWSDLNQLHNRLNSESSGCVFIRGFRAKRIFNLKKIEAFAEHQPDNPDNEPDSSLELVREPRVPGYRDPLIGALDYIAEQSSSQKLAIAHEDDLKLIEGLDVMTADAVENFLRQHKFPVESDKGVALLGGKDKGQVPEDEKMTFNAQSELGGEPVPLIIHPVLMKYLLKFDISTQPVDHDWKLPQEDLLSAAVHPPVYVLLLENDQGHPHNIEVHASDKESGIGITVEDVLRTVGTDLRKSSSQREWAALTDDRRREVEEVFENRARTEQDRSGGLRMIDYLRGRNRLEIFAKHPALEDEEDIPHLQRLRGRSSIGTHPREVT